MIDGDGPFVFGYFFEEFFGVRLIWEDKFKVAVIDFLGAYETRKELFSVFKIDLIFSIDDHLGGKYLEADQGILVDF